MVCPEAETTLSMLLSLLRRKGLESDLAVSAKSSPSEIFRMRTQERTRLIRRISRFARCFGAATSSVVSLDFDAHNVDFLQIGTADSHFSGNLDVRNVGWLLAEQ